MCIWIIICLTRDLSILFHWYISWFFLSELALCSVDGAVKLIGGDSVSEGTVQVCRSGVWGTVCDDYWGSSDASVVCSQLNLSGNGMGE